MGCEDVADPFPIRSRLNQREDVDTELACTPCPTTPIVAADVVQVSSKAQRQQMSNSSSLNEFLLLDFADRRELQLFHFLLFLGIYLAALLALDLVMSILYSVVPPAVNPLIYSMRNKELKESPKDQRKQMSNSSFLNEFLLLEFADRRELQLLHFSLFLGIYLAALLSNGLIITALHYGTLMGSRACAKMAAAAWGSGFLYALLHTGNTFSIPLCQGNTVDQFFCEIPQLLKLSCSDSYLREAGLVVASVCLVFGCFVFIVVSYVQIFTVVLRIPSEQGRHKAFSMCLPHLAVVSLFVSTDMVAYLKPPSISSPALDLVVTVLYAVVPPEVSGHPDKVNYYPPRLSTGVDISRIGCPSVGCPVVEEWGGTGEGPEEVCEDEVRGLKDKASMERLQDLGFFSLVKGRLRAVEEESVTA
ncbi:olfactory receptor 14A16-like [Dromaius novaehollandiae]|uniref:olfactory receptor 14A16-like n=1 Tax=Dromaius novaehollandiae TaxID=8790 RepID=UPI00311E3428